jgi:hypothetical protein
LEGLKSTSYSKLNKEGILAPPIPSGFWTPKLALRVSLRATKPEGIEGAKFLFLFKIE